jgi:hypothetical protein
MALLRDPKLRQFMERNAVEYIYQDHFTKSIETGRKLKISSSLANLSVAVTRLAGPLVFDYFSSQPFSFSLPISSDCISPSPPEHLWPESRRVNPLRFQVVKEVFCESHSVEESVLSWAECQCTQSPLSRLTSATSFTRPFSSTTLNRVRNVSSPCLYRMSNEIFLGYLIKRHQFQSIPSHFSPPLSSPKLTS